MPTGKKHQHLSDSYRVPGFIPSTTVKGIFGDSCARIVTLTRRSKKRHVARAVACKAVGTTVSGDGREICRVATRVCMLSLRFGVSTARLATL